jgi:hypothetical protein
MLPQISSSVPGAWPRSAIGMSRAERVGQTLELAHHPIPDAIWPRLDEVGFATDDLETYRFK